MPRSIRTERLLLRPWMTADTTWHRPLVEERGGGPFSAADDAAAVDFQMRAPRDQGFGLSVLVHEGDPIGYAGLVVGRSTVDEPELAYELLRRRHGRGYATEAARAVIEAARLAGHARLWSTTRPANTASLRVMAKLGFVHDRDDSDDRGVFLWNRLDLDPA